MNVRMERILEVQCFLVPLAPLDGHSIVACGVRMGLSMLN